MRNRTQVWLENVIYALIWLVVFIVPLFGFYTSGGIRWEAVHRFWLNVLPFLALFAVNNYLLTPFFLLRKRYLSYALTVVAAIGLLFTAMPLATGKHTHNFPPFRDRPDHFLFDGRSDSLGAFRPFPADAPRPSFAQDTLRRGFGPGADFEKRFPDKFSVPPHMPPIRWVPMLNDWLLAILLIGFNVAIRLMFRSIADARRMEELERRNIRTELDHLKAQVNPHFLMNTLNNIHALIDIDNGKAKSTVIELSKIMRYMLYESDRQLVPLRNEIGFLENYTSLMSIRYTHEVRIETFYPGTGTENVYIPPLLLIAILENAFKHGLGSRGGEAYIFAELTVAAGRLVYRVRNSVGSASAREPGLGLENLRKRLGLLYGERYALTITSTDDEYAAELTIPLEV